MFDAPVGDGKWFATQWARVPEAAIALERDSLDDLAAHAGLKVRHVHPGTWRERPGVYFQDVAVLESSGAS